MASKEEARNSVGDTLVGDWVQVSIDFPVSHKVIANIPNQMAIPKTA